MDSPRAGGGGDQLRRFRRLADLTALITLLLVVVGGVVRVSDSGLGCGPEGSGTEGWPLCGGAVIPLVGDENRLIEFAHRALAGVVVVLIALLCWRAYQELRSRRWALRGSVAAGVLVLAQAGLGGLTVEHGLEDELVAAHLGLAMLLLGLLLWLSARARADAAEEVPDGEPSERSIHAMRVPGLKPFAAIAAVLLLSAIVAGGYMAGTEKEGVHGDGRNVAGAHLACGEQFPECGEGRFLPFADNRLTDIHLTHRALVYAATLAILALLGVALVRGSRDRWLAIAGLLLLVQLLLGALNVWLGEHATLIVAHLTTGTLLWIAVLEIGFRLAWFPAATLAHRPAPRAETSAAAA
ncbi:MAG TPA: COX15/CtaA family protein, partial [Solirubrobacterales bacterium]|nr:COX15/CtaA family protein [Solirubrobacterales bacterium]